MIDAPVITQTAEQLIARIHLLVPRDEIQVVMGPAIREIYAVLAAHGIAPAGPWLTHHHRRPTDVFDFDACVPVGTPVSPSGRVQPGRLPASRVARTVYQGPYEGLAAAWGEFFDWINGQELTPRADLWECYAVGPESGGHPSTWRTELNCPLEA